MVALPADHPDHYTDRSCGVCHAELPYLPAVGTPASPQQLLTRAGEIAQGWKDEGRTQAAVAAEFGTVLGVPDPNPHKDP